MEKVRDTLVSCINNPEVLSQAAQILKPLEASSGYSQTLAEILAKDPVPELQQFAGILLKNHINDYWETLSSTARNQTKQTLLNALPNGSEKVKSMVGLALGGIVLREFPDQWPNCFVELLSRAKSNQSSLDSVLTAVSIIFSNCDDRLSKACPLLIPTLYEIYQQSPSTLVLRVLSQCFESLSWADGVDQELVESSLDPIWSDWFNQLLSVLQSDCSPNDKRLSLKVLTVFFRDFVTYSHHWFSEIINPIWELLLCVIPRYQAEVVHYKEHLVGDLWEEDVSAGVEGLVTQLLELVSCLVLRPGLGTALQEELVPLLNNLCWYLHLTKDQEQIYFSDPNQFIADEELEFYKSPRTASLKLFSDLIEIFGEVAVEGIVKVVENMLLNTSQPSKNLLIYSSHSEMHPVLESLNSALVEIITANQEEHSWKTRETAVLLLGSIATDIIAYNAKSKKSEKPPLEVGHVFETVILSDIKYPNSALGSKFLKGRSLWCTAKLSDLMSPDHPMINTIFRICGECLEDNSIAVRLSACYALCRLSKKVSGMQPEVVEALPRVLMSVTRLVEISSSETLHLVLDTLVEASNLNAEIASQVPCYGSGLFLRLFTTFYGDGSLYNKILSVIRFWADLPQGLKPLTETFVPFILNLLNAYPLNYEKVDSMSSTSTIDSRSNTDNVLILPSALELSMILLRKSKSGSSERGRLCEMMRPLLDLLSKTEDISLLLQGTGCLRSFTAYAHEEIIASNLTEKFIEVASILLDPAKNEAGALHLGYFIVNIFSKLSPRVDEDLLIGTLNKLHKSKMPSIVQGFVLIFARLIHSHPLEIISFLSNVSVDRRVALKVLLDKWLIHQPLIRGRYTKNATITSLTRLFTLKEERLESLLVVGYNPSHSNVCSEVLAPFKILCTLIRCLDNESMPRRKQTALEEEGEFQTVVEGSGIGVVGDYEEERMDTVEDDPDDPMDSLKVDLMNEVGEDYDQHEFNIPESKDKGLGDYEIGSECLMSDMLDFDYDDTDDVGEDFYEDDMYNLTDWYGGISLQTFLLEFFNNMIQNDRDYLLSCMNHLLPEDSALFKKHFTF